MPIEPSVVDWRAVALGLLSLMTAILSFVVNGVRNEMQRQSSKLAEIDKMYINRTELKDELKQIGERIEGRHRENQQALETIVDKIDTYETRESQTRHDIRDSVNALVLQDAAWQAEFKAWRNNYDRNLERIERFESQRNAAGFYPLPQSPADKNSR